jgi:ABC-2 type transport system permease protein
MNKTWIVARHEYLHNLKRPSFLFAAFGVPLFTFIMYIVIFAVTVGNEQDTQQIGKIGYVDQAGVLNDLTLPKIESGETFPELVVFNDDAAARAALDEKTIGAYFVVPADYMTTGQVTTYSYSGIPEARKNDIENLMQANISHQVNTDVPLERIQNPVNMTIHVADSGRDLTEANIPALIFLPLIFAMVIMMASMPTVWASLSIAAPTTDSLRPSFSLMRRLMA